EPSIKKEPIGENKEIYVSFHHSFGTDAILLANFANARPGDSYVDLGTGCGIIPFLLLRDKHLKKAVGVDISREAIFLAQKTKDEWKAEEFEPICADLKDLRGKVENGCHTLVTCNPPYKAACAGLKNPDSVLMNARHETACSLEDIISVAAHLLQTGGRLCMCHRPERMAELLSLMRQYKVEPKRLRLVCQRAGEEPWLILVEGKRCANTGLRISPTLYVEDENGDFSQEMIDIYASYKKEHL
ncbi:MAG: methyltransferase, partial [Clostridia bacterium]|nr:methyltransferase [Clostridia bacterium]